MNEYIKVGYTKKTFGVRGGLKAHIEDNYLEALINTDVVFLQINNKPTPFFIESIEETNALILYFEEIKTKEEAYPVCAKEIYLRREDIPGGAIPDKEEATDFLGYLNYRMEVKGVGEIGKIEDVMELPEQFMAIIQYQGRELLIPLNEHFIEKVDHQKQMLLMDLPEGLLDL